jgi:hypothetical protein
MQYARVKNGLYFEERRSDGGGVSVAYDRSLSGGSPAAVSLLRAACPIASRS